MNYKIEKDNVLNCFIVWEIHQKYKIDRYRGLKRECRAWIAKNTK